jgi:hypothetical protein
MTCNTSSDTQEFQTYTTNRSGSSLSQENNTSTDPGARDIMYVGFNQEIEDNDLVSTVDNNVIRSIHQCTLAE